MLIEIRLKMTEEDADDVVVALRAYKGARTRMEACKDIAQLVERQASEQKGIREVEGK